MTYLILLCHRINLSVVVRDCGPSGHLSPCAFKYPRRESRGPYAWLGRDIIRFFVIFSKVSIRDLEEQLNGLLPIPELWDIIEGKLSQKWIIFISNRAQGPGGWHLVLDMKNSRIYAKASDMESLKNEPQYVMDRYLAIIKTTIIAPFRWTRQQAADFLRISKRHIQRLVRAFRIFGIPGLRLKSKRIQPVPQR